MPRTSFYDQIIISFVGQLAFIGAWPLEARGHIDCNEISLFPKDTRSVSGAIGVDLDLRLPRPLVLPPEDQLIAPIRRAQALSSSLGAAKARESSLYGVPVKTYYLSQSLEPDFFDLDGAVGIGLNDRTGHVYLVTKARRFDGMLFGNPFTRGWPKIDRGLLLVVEGAEQSLVDQLNREISRYQISEERCKGSFWNIGCVYNAHEVLIQAGWPFSETETPKYLAHDYMQAVFKSLSDLNSEAKVSWVIVDDGHGKSPPQFVSIFLKQMSAYSLRGLKVGISGLFRRMHF